MTDLPIVDATGLAEAVTRLRAGPEGRRTVAWTNGCFDLFHHGHLANLMACAGEADVLVVGVNGDESVRRLKGPGRPVVPGVERMALVAALRCVDLVVSLDDDEPSSLIEAAGPDVVCKGADYATGDKPMPERRVVEELGARWAFIPLVPGASTTDRLRAIRAAEEEG